MSGEHDYAPGDVHITIPASIIVNRDGTQGDTLVIPFPEAPSTTKDFNWQLSADASGNPVYVLTNTRKLSAATKGFIQFGFSNVVPHKVVDAYANNPETGAPTTATNKAHSTSDPFQAVIEVTTHAGNTIGRATNQLTAQIDTEQKLTQVVKRNAWNRTTRELKDLTVSKDELIKVYTQDKKTLPDGLEDADYYVVVDWDVDAHHAGNQEFSTDISDQIPGDNGGQSYNGKVIRAWVRDSDQRYYPCNSTITIPNSFSGWDENGYLRYSITTAYPLTEENFPYNGNVYGSDWSPSNPNAYYHVLNNTADVTLVEADTGTSSSHKDSASLKFHWSKPKRTSPRGHFNLFKWGNDGNDAEHMSADISSYGPYTTHYPASLSALTNQSPRAKGFDPSSFYNGTYKKFQGIYYDALNRLSGAREEPEDAKITYSIESDAYLLPWTYSGGGNPYNNSDATTNSSYYTMSNFGKNTVTTVVADKGLTMDGVALTPLEDYTFEDLYIPLPLVGYAKASNLSPTGEWINRADDGTFVYNSATDYSNINNLENDGSVAGELGAAEPLYVDIEVRNSDGTTTWINNYVKLDYSEYKRADRRKAGYNQALITYYYDEKGNLIDNPQPEAEKGTIVDRLPDNMVNFRTHVTSNKAYYHYYVLPTVKLKASIDDQATKPTEIATAAFGSEGNRNTAPSILVRNDVTMQAYQGQHYPGDDSGTSVGKPLFDKTEDGTDELRGYVTDSMAVPSKSGYLIGQSGTRVSLHYSAKIEFKSLISSKEAYSKEVENGHIPQVTEGVWYDHLPAGLAPDLSSVKLRDGDAIQAAYAIPNYRQSGRTMLVVKATLQPQPQGYKVNEKDAAYYEDVPTLDFDAVCDANALKDHGINPHNVVAFQATQANVDFLGSVDGYEGEYDTPAHEGAQNLVTTIEDGTSPTTVTDKEREWLTDLDNDGLSGAGSGEAPLFLYAGTVTNIDVVFAAQQGLSKSVSTNVDGHWSTGKDPGDIRMVYEDGYYTYRLRV